MQRLRLSDVPAAVRASAAWAAGHGPLHDVLFGVLFSLLFTALRLVLHRALAPRAKRALARRGAGAEQALVALSEDMWEGVGAVLFMTAAVYVLLRHNYGCLPWDTASCIHGWPQHESNPYLDWLYLIKLGWVRVHSRFFFCPETQPA